MSTVPARLTATVHRSHTHAARELLALTGLPLFTVVAGDLRLVEDLPETPATALAAAWNATLHQLAALHQLRPCQDPHCTGPAVARVYDRTDDYRSLCAFHAVDTHRHIDGARFELTLPARRHGAPA